MFKAFLHVERLGTPEVDGYLDGRVYVTPKIDGTNACVWYEDGAWHAGSRKREITPDNDNAGFADYVLNSDDHVAVTVRDFTKNHNVIVYGEWLGAEGCKMPGAIKQYLEQGFFVFDVFDVDNLVYCSPDTALYQELEERLGNHFLSPIACINNPTEEQLSEIIEHNHINLPPNVIGEGIVMKNYDYKDEFGHFQMAKIVRKEFKERKAIKKRAMHTGAVESDIIAYYVTESELSKTMAKVCTTCNRDEFDNKSKEMVGRFLGMAWNDLLVENIMDIDKRFHSPTIDLKRLKSECYGKCRTFIGIQ
jgi:hypothetical protein